MVYSNTPYPQKEADFPPPPMYLTWIRVYDYRTHKISADGQIRHHDSLKNARRYLSRYGYGDSWYNDWALYEWDGKKYVLLYSGDRGKPKSRHPLFSTPLKGGEAPVREADEDEVDAAIMSILGGAQ